MIFGTKVFKPLHKGAEGITELIFFIRQFVEMHIAKGDTDSEGYCDTGSISRSFTRRKTILVLC
jgi:hypothetical protein